MIMLQECTKNIEKLEFRPSAKKKQKQQTLTNENSPSKLAMGAKTTSVCLVDLIAESLPD